jgi:hypothetical protein
LEIKVLCGDTPLTLQGKAVWYLQQEDEEPFAFRIGIELTDLTPELREGIRDLIDLKRSTHDVSPPPEPEKSL